MISGTRIRTVVGASFVLFVPRGEVTTVIAEENKDRVLSKSFFFQYVARAAHGVVDGFNAAIIIRQLCLPDTRLFPQIFWHRFVQISFGRTIGSDGTMHIVLLVRLEV